MICLQILMVVTMATISEVIVQAREIIQDTREASYRHSDDKLMRYFNNATRDAVRVRVDFMLNGQKAATWGAIPEFTAQDITDGTEFPFDPRFLTAFVDYIAGFVGMGDDEYAVEGRAVALLNRFIQKLQSQGA